MRPGLLKSLSRHAVGPVLVLTCLVLLAAAGYAQRGAARAPATTCTWDGATGNFNDPTHWSCGMVPGAADDVVINNGGVTVTANATINNLNLGGGLLTSGAGTTLTANGFVSTWTGGTMSGGGTTAIGGTLRLLGSGGQTLSQRTLDVQGTLIWASTGTLSHGNGASIVVHNLFDITNDGGTSFNQGGARSQITVAPGATLRKSAGSGQSTLDFALDNDGTVQAQTGTLALAGGTSSGAYTVASTLQFSGPDSALDASSSLSGAGTVRFAGGTNTIAGTYNVGTTEILSGAAIIESANAQTGTLTLNGGVLGGSGTLTLTGPSSSWTTGSISGSGTVVIPSGTMLSMSGSGGGRTIVQHTLDVSGTLVWDGTSGISHGGALITLEGNSLFDITGDGSTSFNQGGGRSQVMVLAGATLRKSAGSGQSTLDFVVDNDGTVQAQTGTLALAGGTGGTSSGAYTVASTLQFSGPDGALDASSSLSGGGTVRFSGGTNTIAGTYNVGTTEILSGAAIIESANAQTGMLTLSGGVLGGSGTLTLTGSASTWTGGAISGSGTLAIPVGRTLTMTGGQARTLTAHRIDVLGTLVSNSGNFLSHGNGAVISVGAGGLFDITNVAPTSYNQGGIRGEIDIAPGGVLRKSDPAGPTNIDMGIDNNGTVQALTGTLQLTGGGGQDQISDGSYTVQTGATLLFGGSGQQTLSASSSVSGAGRVVFADSAQVDMSGLYSVSGTTEIVGGSAARFQNQGMQTGMLLLTGGDPRRAGESPDQRERPWTGGTMTQSGTTVVPAGVTLEIADGGGQTLTQRTLDVFGTLSWTATTAFQHGNGASIRIRPGATFDITGDASTTYNQGGVRGQLTIDPNGLLRKSAGAGTSTIDMAVTNHGTVETLSGTTFLSGGFTNFSGTTLTGGTYDLQAPFKFTGANVVTNAADVTLDGPGSALQNENGGDGLAGFATNAPSGALIVRNRALVVPGPFANQGDLAVDAGTFTVTNGSLTNSGLLRGNGTVSANVTSSARSRGLLAGPAHDRGRLRPAGGRSAANRDRGPERAVSTTGSSSAALRQPWAAR